MNIIFKPQDIQAMSFTEENFPFEITIEGRITGTLKYELRLTESIRFVLTKKEGINYEEHKENT